MCASMVGLSTFLILRAMIFVERSGNTTLRVKNNIVYKACKISASFGRESLYVYLVHTFFAYTFVSAAKKALSFVGITGDTHLVYIVLFPVVAFLSFYFGLALKKITKGIISWMTR